MDEFMALKDSIHDVMNFPNEGVVFKDLGPVWANPLLNAEVLESLKQRVEKNLGIPDCVVGIESRGFIFGMPLALSWAVPFIPFRKPGKLPGKVQQVSYDLEYGSAALECQSGMIPKQSKVLLHDDVLATGGTLEAAARLVEMHGATVMGCSVIIELMALGGKARLGKSKCEVESLVKY